MYRVLLCASLFLLTACGAEQKKPSVALFAGEIVNPTSDYVVLLKGDQVIDSTRLDENNRFSFDLSTVQEGLYNFYHRPEYQYVYLRQGDSLMTRLNTYDFDESLVFSGTGEEINNFLLEMFLAYETDEDIINDNYDLDPEAFSTLIDSLRNAKVSMLNELSEEVEFSDPMLELAKASIDYNYYVHKEKYPFHHKKMKSEKSIHDLPDDFYAYRTSLNLDNKNLTFFRPYHEFMKFHFGNLSYMNCAHDCGNFAKKIKNPLHFNSHQLYVIDSLVGEKDLRDNLFRSVAVDYLIKVHDKEPNIEKFIEKFHMLSGNNRHMDEINGLYESIKNLQPNKTIPSVKLFNSEGEETNITTIAEKQNVVFYFWTGTQRKHFEDVTNQATTLSAKYPDRKFIGINFRTDAKQWKSMIEAKKLDLSTQFRSDDFEALYNALIISYGNKSIICEDGLVVDAFADIYTSF